MVRVARTHNMVLPQWGLTEIIGLLWFYKTLVVYFG